MKKAKVDYRVFIGDNSLIDRRTFLLGLSRVMGAGSLALIPERWLSGGNPLYAATSGNLLDAEGIPLRKRAAAKGLLFGAATGYGLLSQQKGFAELFVRECGILVPESELKWARLRPAPDKYDFAQADWMMEFARENSLLLRGHTLVWHEALPKWFPEVVTPKNAEKFLREHIKTVVGRYVGRMHSWDVVNEPIASWDRRPDGLRNTPWLKLLGPQYIEIAFHAAAAADPKAMLVLNQNHLEYDTKDDEEIRSATLRLLEGLKKRGVPIHALGIESHLTGDETRFNPAKFRRFLQQVADLDLKILITELDVEDQKLTADVGMRDKIIAEKYAEFLSAALAEPAVIAVITWGLSDRSTWLSSYKPREDRQPVRTLPFDKDLRPKPAWHAIAKAIGNASGR